jgi:hypothetical protein
MPSLRELQQAIYQSLVHGDDREAASHILADGLAAEARLRVYRNNVIGSLTNALRLHYPAVCRLVGVEFFAGTAEQFIRVSPPETACLDDYGDGFAVFLAAFPPAAGLCYLAGVARLEWAVSRALHAPDISALGPNALAAIDPAEHPRVCFTPHPAVGLLCDDTPVDLIWRAVIDRDDAVMGAIDLGAGPVRLLVERGSCGVEISRLDPAAWRFAADLFAGRPIGEAVAAAPFNAAELLAEHLLAGRFAGVELTMLPERHR